MVIWVIKTFFVQFFCILLPPFPNVFCICLVLTISVFYHVHPCVKYSLGIFLKKTLVFPILLFSFISLHFSLNFIQVQLLSHVRLFTQEDFLNPACYSLELCFQLGTSFPFPLAFCFSSICKTSSDNHFAFLHFFSLG